MARDEEIWRLLSSQVISVSLDIARSRNLLEMCRTISQITKAARETGLARQIYWLFTKTG